MIKYVGTYKKFGNLVALNNISVTIERGTCTALVGPNGSGKTTLLKCFLGMVVPDSGQILLNENIINHQWRYRNDVGYMPQIGRYPDNMTIGQVLDMVRDLRKDAINQDLELYELFGLSSLLEKRMNTLSGGTRQKVSACLAFMFDPSVLILDEPTAGLDPVNSFYLKEKIQKSKTEGKTIVLSSHVLSELDDLASHVLCILDGNIMFHYSIDEIRKISGENSLAKAVALIMKKNHIDE